jgi:hypothetical protein
MSHIGIQRRVSKLNPFAVAHRRQVAALVFGGGEGHDSFRFEESPCFARIRRESGCAGNSNASWPRSPSPRPGVPSLAAALEIEPGEWRTTETSTVNGKTEKPEISTECVTAAEVRDPMKALSEMKQQGEQCRRLDAKQNGNTISFVMQCGDPKQGSVDMALTFVFDGTRHYTGLYKSEISFGGQKMASQGTMDARWVGACKK